MVPRPVSMKLTRPVGVPTELETVTLTVSGVVVRTGFGVDTRVTESTGTLAMTRVAVAVPA